MSPEKAPLPRKKSGPIAALGRYRSWIWAAAIIVVLLFGYSYMKSRAGPTTGRMILGKVVTGDLTETVTATGSVNAQTGAEVHIGSQVAGRIKKLNADIGTQVKPGDIIAELDLPELKAQLEQAKAVLSQAQLKYAQEVAGTDLEATQTSSAISTALAGGQSAAQKLTVAQANFAQQSIATPADIKKATSGLEVARSGFSVSEANLKSVESTSTLSVANAQEQLSQSQANAANSAAMEKRVFELVSQGFAAKADYDTAHAQAQVNASQVRAAEKGLKLTQDKVQQDIATALEQVKQAAQTVSAAKATLESAMSEVHLTTARGAEVQDARASIRQAKAALDVANAGQANDTIKAESVRIESDAVMQARQALAYSQAQFNKSYIRSPIAGTVLALSSQQGETVAAGLSTQTLIIVADLKRLQIDAYVDETDVAKVKLGQPVRFSVSAFPGRTFEGTVQKIASGSTIQQGVVTYDITVSIRDHSIALKPDMTANVTIETGRKSKVLLIPAVAIQSTTKGSTVNLVKVVNGKQSVKSVRIVTGGSDGVNVEVLSGLHDGDQIVLAGVIQGNAPTTSSAFSSQGGGGGGGRGGGGGGGGGR